MSFIQTLVVTIAFAVIGGTTFGVTVGVMRKAMKIATTESQVRIEYVALSKQYSALLNEWNALVEKINAKGGKEFLNGAPPPALTDKDIKAMLMLCHPDKHNGSKVASEITVKLLGMRAR